jgi:Leucine-rich repeat (LRR) protein
LALQTLNLRDAQLTDKTVVKLAEKCPNMVIFNISASKIGDESLVAIGNNMKTLKNLNISNATISKIGAEAIFSLSKLEILDAGKKLLFCDFYKR